MTMNLGRLPCDVLLPGVDRGCPGAGLWGGVRVNDPVNRQPRRGDMYLHRRSRTLEKCIQCDEPMFVWACQKGLKKYCSKRCANAAKRVARADLVTRFWAHVAVRGPDQCWPWTASRNESRGGYGQIRTQDGRTLKAHRVAYEIQHGPIPRGLFVCHRCNNPICCNPHHLYAGTPAENAADTIAAGRVYHIPPLRGEASPHAKLTAAEVLEILASTDGHQRLARIYGVSRQAIFRIRKGLTWKNALQI